MKILEKISEILRNKRSRYLVIILAAIVVFVTTYSMILPAITIEKDHATEEAGFYLTENDPEGSDLIDSNLEKLTENAEQTASEAETSVSDTSNTKIAENNEAEEVQNVAENIEEAAANKEMPALIFDAEITTSGQIATAEGLTPEQEQQKEQIKEENTAEALISVKAEAKAGTFPEGTVMQVKETAAEQKVETAELYFGLECPIRFGNL